MAQIDVVELFTDPDFVDDIVLIRRSAAVSTLGENFIKETRFNSVGSIQPTDGKTLKRLPQSLQNENVSTFWFQGEIGDTDSCKYPSILVFKGRRYQIRQVMDWTNWGGGWCEGICVQEKLT